MAFDPDEFLKETSAPTPAPSAAFDPDAFLAEAPVQSLDRLNLPPAPEPLKVEPPKPNDESWDITRGAKTALMQTPQLAYGVAGLVGAAAKELTGYGETLRDWGLRGYKDWEQAAEPISKENDNVSVAWKKAQNGDIGALIDWAQYGVGYALGQLGETAAIATLGGLAGGAAAAETGPLAAPAAAGGAVLAAAGKTGFKAIAKNLIEKAIAKQAIKIAEEEAVKTGAKLTAEEIAKKATTSEIKQLAGKEIGSNIAILGNAIGMELGSIYGDAESQAMAEGRQLTGLDLARVWGTGLAAGGIEGVTDKLGLDLLKGKFAAKLPAGRLAGAAVAGGIGILGEGITEAAQTAIERAGAKKNVLDDEAVNDYINSAALGALGGGVIGGAGGFIAGNPKENAAAKAKVASEALKNIAPETAKIVGDQANAVINETVQETPEQRVARLKVEAQAAKEITLEEQPPVAGLPTTPEVAQTAQARITEREGKAATPVETPAGTRIEAAAYQAPDGTVYYGASHLDAMAKARDAGKIDQAAIDAKQEVTSRETPEFGFATDKEPFIGRSQAEVVATGSGQMLVDKPATGLLHSNEVSLDAFAQPAKPTQPITATRTVADAIRDKDTFIYNDQRGAVSVEDGVTVFRPFGTQDKFEIGINPNQTIGEIEGIEWARKGQVRTTPIESKPEIATIVEGNTALTDSGQTITTDDEIDQEESEFEVPTALVEIEKSQTLNDLTDLFETGESKVSQDGKRAKKVSQTPEFYRQATPQQIGLARRLIDNALRIIDALSISDQQKQDMAEPFLLLDQDITNYENNPEYQRYKASIRKEVRPTGKAGALPETETEVAAAISELEQRAKAEAERLERAKRVTTVTPPVTPEVTTAAEPQIPQKAQPLVNALKKQLGSGVKIKIVDTLKGLERSAAVVTLDKDGNVNVTVILSGIDALVESSKNPEALQKAIEKIADEEADHVAAIKTIGYEGVLAAARRLSPAEREAVAKLYISRSNFATDAEYNNAIKEFAATKDGMTQEQIDSALQLIGFEHLRQVGQRVRSGQTTEDIFNAKTANPSVVKSVLQYLAKLASQIKAKLKVKFDANLQADLKRIEEYRKNLQAIIPTTAETIPAPTSVTLTKEERAAVAITKLKGVEQRATGVYFIPEKLMTPERRRKLKKSITDWRMGGETVIVRNASEVLGDPRASGYIISNRLETSPERFKLATGRVAPAPTPEVREAINIELNPEMASSEDFNNWLISNKLRTIEYMGEGGRGWLAPPMSFDLPSNLEDAIKSGLVPNTPTNRNIAKAAKDEALNLRLRKRPATDKANKILKPIIERWNKEFSDKKDYNSRVLNNTNNFLHALLSENALEMGRDVIKENVEKYGLKSFAEKEGFVLVDGVYSKKQSSELEKFRIESIQEIEKNKPRINEIISSVLKIPFDVKIIGSVLDKKNFTEDSDIDIGIYISSKNYPLGVVDSISEKVQDLFKNVPFSFGVLNTNVINTSRIATEVREARREPAITPQQDADYLAAVEGGDSGTDNLSVLLRASKAEDRPSVYQQWAERNPRAAATVLSVVNELAQKAGFTSPIVFHGSIAKGVTRFDVGQAVEVEGGIFFTTNEDVAAQYTFERAYGDIISDEPLGEVTAAKLRMTNPFEYQAKGKIVDAVEMQRVIDQAKANGFDGVIIRNIDDSIGMTGDMGDVYVVFNGNQIKSADPVTYDDQGNIIPISQRFQPEEADIRYARRGQQLSDSLDSGDFVSAQALVEGGATMDRATFLRSITPSATQRATTIHTRLERDGIISKDEFTNEKGLVYGDGRGAASTYLGAESYEPFPPAGFTPDYSGDRVAGQGAPIGKKFRTILNTFVLNVVDPQTRSFIVKDIANLLQNGGRAVFVTRGTDVANSKALVSFGPLERIQRSEGKLTYQKGFTQPELIQYLQETLGNGFTVRALRGGSASDVRVEVVKNTDAALDNPTIVPEARERRRVQMGRAGMEQSAVEARLQELGFPAGGIIKVVNQPDADFEGRTIIVDGKVTGIELNAAAMRDNATIDRVLNHEFAESANADGALNKLVERLTPKEKKEINDTITRLRYEEKARTSEEAARAIETLAEAWKGRGFFTRAVARIEAWANKLGFKLTRRAAEYIAARNLAEVNENVRKWHIGEAMTNLKGARKVSFNGLQAVLIPPSEMRVAYSIAAYHGTPHQIKGRFKLSKIGTGEGEQVFGWGLYFAENIDVAARYRDQLAKEEKYDGEEYNPNDPRHVAADKLAVGKMLDKTREEVIRDLEDNADLFSGSDKFKSITLKQAAEALRTNQEAKLERVGNIYSVDLDIEPDDVLDWDRFYSSQPEKIQKAIQSVLGFSEETKEYWLDTLREDLAENGPMGYPDSRLERVFEEMIAFGGYGEEFGAQVFDELREAAPEKADEFIDLVERIGTGGLDASDTGETVYRMLVARFNSAEEASRRLLQAGVKGIKYLDGQSRELEKGTRNYVIFDEDVIKITGRNGQPVDIRESRREPEAIPTFTEGTPEAVTLKEMEASMAKVDAASEAKGGKPETQKISDITANWMDQGGDERALQDAIVEYTNLTPANAQKVARAIARQYDIQQSIATAFLETQAGLSVKALPEGVTLPKEVDPDRPKPVMQRLFEVFMGVKVPPKKITGSEKAFLRDQIRLKIAANRAAKNAQKATADGVIETIKSMGLYGEVRPKQVAALAKRAARVIWTSEKSVEAFNDYAAKVVSNANYDADLREAKTAQKRAKQLSKQKNVAFSPQRQVLDNISKVAVNRLDNPRMFADVVNYYMRAFKTPLSPDYVVMPDAELTSYLSQMESEATTNQAEIDRVANERLAAKYGVSIDEVQKIIESDNIIAELQKVEDREQMEKLLNDKAIESQEGLASYDMDRLSDKQKPLVESLMKVDPRLLDAKEKQKLIRLINNVIYNDQTNGAQIFIAIASGQENARKAAKDSGMIKKNRAWIDILPTLGSGLAEKTFRNWALELQSVADTFRNIFGKEATGKMFRLMGLYDLDRGFTDSNNVLDSIQEAMAKFYKENVKKYGKAARSQDGILSEGIVGFLIQRVPAKGETESIAQRRDLIKQDIANRRYSQESDRIAMADRIEKILNEVDGATVEEILNNLKEKYRPNYDSVMYLMNDLLPQYKDFLQSFDENFNDQANNYDNPYYLPIDFISAGPALEITPESEATFYDNVSLRPKQAANTIKRVDYTKLPQDRNGRPREIQFNLRKGTYDSLSEQINAAYTSEAWQKIFSFMKTPEAETALGGGANRDFMVERLNRLRISRMRRGAMNNGAMAKFADSISVISRKLGVGIALGGVFQVFKQSPDQLISAVGTTGRPDLLSESIMSIGSAKPLLNKFSIGRRGDASAGYKYINQMEGAQNRLERAFTESRWSEVKENASKIADIWMVALKKTDFACAAAAWMTYYRADLDKNGIAFQGWDKESQLIESDTARQDAASYAENMTDIYQGSSDPTKMATFAQSGKSGWENLVKAIVVPFNSFAVQQRMRIYSDARDAFTQSGEAKKGGTAGLTATIGGMIMFHTVRRLFLPVLTGVGVSMIYGLLGVDMDEPDEEKKKEEARKRWRQFQGELIANVLVGGAPQIVESKLIDSINYANYIVSLQLESEDVTDDEGKIMTFDKYQKERSPLWRYRSFDNAMTFGMLDIGIGQIEKAALQTKMLATPEEMEKYTPEEQRLLYFSALSEWMYLMRLNDADFARMVSKARKDMTEAVKDREKKIKAIQKQL